MPKEIITGWTLKCPCCKGPLVGGASNEKGEPIEAEHYKIFLTEKDAQAEADAYGVKEIIRVQIAL